MCNYPFPILPFNANGKGKNIIQYYRAILTLASHLTNFKISHSKKKCKCKSIKN